MLAALVVAVTACGGNNNNNKNTTTAPRTSQAATEMTTEATTESGGVLQDMVDGVEQGMDNMLDGTGGTSENGMNGNYTNGNTAGPGTDNLNSATSGK